jgi:AcrR family transcriptional regulator
MSERKNIRRETILSAAEKLFAEKGYENASIRDVSSLAGVADGTIYSYFKNKEALLHELVRGLLERLGKEEEVPIGIAGEASGGIEASAGTELAEGLEGRVLARMRSLHDDYERIAAVLPVALGTPELRIALRDSFIAPVAASLERDLGPGDRAIDARIVLAAVLGFQVLMLIGDEKTKAAWEKPEILAPAWAKFIRAAKAE